MLADIDNPLASRRSVLLYVRGSFHFSLIEPMVRDNRDVEFFLHSNLFGRGEVERANLNKYANFHFVANLDELKFKFDRFGAFITTDAEPAHPHSYSLRLVEFFQAIKVPVFELQHGLFQLGLHYFDVPADFHFSGDSLPAKSFAGQILAYYPPTVVETSAVTIGYPPYAGQPQPSSGHDWTLVLTNLHWPTYTADERRAFYESVYRLAAEGGARVVWKQHHGEIGSAACMALRKELAEKYPLAAERLSLHHEDETLRELRLNALIARATCVVSTVSTVLLDCEMLQKGVALYSCSSVECLVRRVVEKDVFETYDELRAILQKGAKPLVTGCLQPYDNAAFRKALDCAYRETTLSRSEFLTALFALMQPLNSELRWNLVTLKKSVERGMAAICEEFETSDKKILASLARSVEEEKNATAAEVRAQSLVKECDQLRESLVGSERKFDSLVVELESLRQKERDGAAALAASESRMQALVKECDQLRESLIGSDRKTDSLAAELESLRQKERDGAAALAASESRMQALVKECDQLRESLADSDRKFEVLRAELNASQRKEREHAKSMSEAEVRTAELEGRNEALLDELEDCRAREKDALSRLAEAETRAVSAVASKDAVEERLSLLVTEINRVWKRNASYEREDNELRLAYQELLGKRTADESCLKKYEEQIAALRVECGTLRAERDKARVERADRAQRVEGLKAELATCKGQHVADCKRLDDQRRMVASLDGQLKKLMSVVVAERERRRPMRRIKALVKGLTPYGVVCTWQRMVRGSTRERALFACPGLFRRMMRMVKFSLPYGLVRFCGAHKQ